MLVMRGIRRESEYKWLVMLVTTVQFGLHALLSHFS
jgi:hypothetical protein